MIIAAPVVKGGCQMMAQNAPQEPIVVDTPFVQCLRSVEVICVMP